MLDAAARRLAAMRLVVYVLGLVAVAATVALDDRLRSVAVGSVVVVMTGTYAAELHVRRGGAPYTPRQRAGIAAALTGVLLALTLLVAGFVLAGLLVLVGAVLVLRQSALDGTDADDEESGSEAVGES